MNENTNLDEADDKALGYEAVSDEALERAATIAEFGAAYTLGSCSGLSVCPG